MSDWREPSRVLFVDDDRLQRELARDSLSGSVRLECCGSAEEALASLARRPAALVISDVTMPGASGLDLLRQVRRLHPGTDFVLVSGHASVESAVEALRMGAADYLLKPVQWEELGLVVERVLMRRHLVEENTRLRGSLDIVESCQVLASCLDAGDVYAVALDLALRTTERERGIALYYRSSLRLHDGIEARGYEEEAVTRLRAALSEGKPPALEDLVEAQVLVGGPVLTLLGELSEGVTRALAVPIRGDVDEAGVLLLPEEHEPIDEGQIERAEIVAAHASIALRNAERYLQAKERAFIDDCTELYNARYLMEAMDREIRRAERYGSELSVLFLDVDRFKLVNDRHGHLVGSNALRQLSDVLGQCVRQVDTLARYGGDEFTVVLVDTGEEQGLQVAERIRRTVEEAYFEGAQGGLRLTCSVGLATFPRDGASREALLDAADKAMYRAKSQGRNRVCAARSL